MEQPQNKLKKVRKPNSLKLNEFHQLQRSKKINKPEETSKKVKKQIRDLERLIDSGKINEEVQQLKQQQIVELQKELKSKKQDFKQKQKKIDFFQKKYKKIKIVDLKKVQRRLGQVVKQLAKASEEEREQLKQEESTLLEQINYIKYYPKDKQYVSLFSTKLNDHAQQFQKQLINKTKQKTQERQEKKYTIQETQQQDVNDDFFADQEVVVKKKFINKQGKVQDE